jgi:hypothetical protein
MSKTSKKTTAKAAAKTPIVALEKQPEAKTLKIVKGEQKYEGARAAWYAALLAHDGKKADDFVTACTKKPPTLPKSGKAEKPEGWLRYFVREGVAALS